jgi:pyruvate kinase
VVIVAGAPPGVPGSTNALRVHRIGDAADGFAPAYRTAESDAAGAAAEAAVQG